MSPKQAFTALLFASCMATPAMANTTLTLYTSQPSEDAQATVAAFEKAHPDISVKWIRDGTTKLTARLAAELSAGGTPPDVLLIADSVTMASFKQHHQLEAYVSPEARRYDAALYDAQGYYYGTKLITTGIVYHRQAPLTPTAWQDLLNPALKHMTALPSPLYSGAAMIHMATLTHNPQLGWSYYQKLKENGAMPQSGNGAVLSAVSSGSKAYGMVADFMAIREKAKGAPIEFVFPKEGVSAVTEPVAIMKGAPHLEAAKTFVDFVLSPAGQRLVVAQGYIPADPSLPVPAGFPARSDIKLMPLDVNEALSEADHNKQQFSELFGGH